MKSKTYIDIPTKKELSDLAKRFMKILEVKNYTGYRLSKEIPEITEAKITFIRNARNEPSRILIDALLNKFPDISNVWLLTGNGEMFNEDTITKPTSQKPSPPKGNAILLSTDDETEIFVNKNGIRFFEYPNGTTKIEVIKIPFSAYASYLEVFNDEEKLMNEFSKTVFTVDKVAKGNYRAFDVKGDSMNGGGIYDTPSGAEVLAREIGRHLWLDGFHKTDYGFILLTKSAIYHKDIKNYNKDTGTLTLSSRNPNEDDFEISINDVYQVFNVIKRTF